MKKDLEEKPRKAFITMTNVEIDNILINFGYGTKEEKKSLLRSHPHKYVFMDLTCFDPEEFYLEFPNLHGIFSALFCDENKKIEVHIRVENQTFIDQLSKLGFRPVLTTIISCGFIFPRTIAQIINEAFFALEESVASKEDINRAMKFGVNYPKGPFEWAQGRELYIVTLLDELRSKTCDQRYVASKMLRNEI
jgi:3-hydroxybutyryl-CoA dehydrogenase